MYTNKREAETKEIVFCVDMLHSIVGYFYAPQVRSTGKLILSNFSQEIKW